MATTILSIVYCCQRGREGEKEGVGRRKREKGERRRKMEGKNREKGRMERSDTHLLHTNCSYITSLHTYHCGEQLCLSNHSSLSLYCGPPMGLLL